MLEKSHQHLQALARISRLHCTVNIIRHNLKNAFGRPRLWTHPCIIAQLIHRWFHVVLQLRLSMMGWHYHGGVTTANPSDLLQHEERFWKASIMDASIARNIITLFTCH